MKPLKSHTLTPEEKEFLIGLVEADERKNWHRLNQITKWLILAAIVIPLGVIYYFARAL